MSPLAGTHCRRAVSPTPSEFQVSTPTEPSRIRTFVKVAFVIKECLNYVQCILLVTAKECFMLRFALTLNSVIKREAAALFGTRLAHSTLCCPD